MLLNLPVYVPSCLMVVCLCFLSILSENEWVPYQTQNSRSVRTAKGAGVLGIIVPTQTLRVGWTTTSGVLGISSMVGGSNQP